MKRDATIHILGSLVYDKVWFDELLHEAEPQAIEPSIISPKQRKYGPQKNVKKGKSKKW